MRTIELCDGTSLRFWQATATRFEHGRQLIYQRWVVEAPDGWPLLGPIVDPSESDAAREQRIVEWWTARSPSTRHESRRELQSSASEARED